MNVKIRILNLLILFFTLLCVCSFQDQKERIDFRFVQKETALFINKAKANSIENGKYNVYALKFTLNPEGYCITFGYFSSPLEAKELMKFKYYFYVGKELVVVDYNNTFSKKYTIFNSQLKTLKDKLKVKKRMSPEPILGSHFGLVNCFTKQDSSKTFYDNDENIPNDKSIIIYRNDYDLPMQVDSSSFKKNVSEG